MLLVIDIIVLLEGVCQRLGVIIPSSFLILSSLCYIILL